MKEVLGGKGANLAELSSLGIAVPSGYTLPCALSIAHLTNPESYSTDIAMLITMGEEYLAGEFGYFPLVSVRSGSRQSMPGMMDTILNVGLTKSAMPEWEGRIGRRAMLDSRRRLIQMYASVALNVPLELFEDQLDIMRKAAGVDSDADLNEDHLNRLCTKYLTVIESLGLEFPETREEQITGAVLAVFDSWNNQRAKDYRAVNDIPYEWGTAATVQAMVFGNFDDKSATGVMFTRDPSTGSKGFIGDWLINAQGEDVVAGIRATSPICDMLDWDEDLFNELEGIGCALEAHFKDMQDIEFTIQSGKLFILQARNGKRSAQACFTIAHDLAVEEIINKEEAVQRVCKEQLFASMTKQVDPKFKVKPDLTGKAAGGSVVTGVVVLTSADAVNCTEPCILVTEETDPDDFAGMAKSVGILTATGGLTSHAAVVARGMNKACVVGASEMKISNNSFHVPGGKAIGAGTKITIDGSTGNVWFGIEVPVLPGTPSAECRTLCAWALSDDQTSERLEVTGDMSYSDIDAAIEALSLSSVQIDCASLELDAADRYEAIDRLAYIGKKLAANLPDAIIINMKRLASYAPIEDSAFYSMFSTKRASFDPEWVASALQAWPAKSKSVAAVKGGDVPGFNSYATVSKFGDLLTASGPIEVSEATMFNVFGGVEQYEIAKLMVEQNLDKKLVSTKPAYWYQFLGA